MFQMQLRHMYEAGINRRFGFNDKRKFDYRYRLSSLACFVFREM